MCQTISFPLCLWQVFTWCKNRNSIHIWLWSHSVSTASNHSKDIQTMRMSDITNSDLKWPIIDSTKHKLDKWTSQSLLPGMSRQSWIGKTLQRWNIQQYCGSVEFYNKIHLHLFSINSCVRTLGYGSGVANPFQHYAKVRTYKCVYLNYYFLLSRQMLSYI